MALTLVPDEPDLGPSDPERRASAGPAAAPARGGLLPAIRWSLLSISVVCLWAVLYAMVLSGWQEARSQHLLAASFREQRALDTVPTGGAIARGAPVAVLDAPRGGLHHLVVVEGTRADQLTHGPGHRADTPLPGQVGAAVVLGRSATFGGPFAALTRLRRGDEIQVTTGQGRFRYRVEDQRRAGDPLPTALPPGGGRLTLVTATRHVGTEPLRLVRVDARLVGPARSAPSDKIQSIDRDEVEMAVDHSALGPLGLWLAGLVAVALGLSWAQSRWARGPALLVAAPCLVALLWGATETASRLLPNLF